MIGIVADDFYNTYKDDLKLLNDYKMNSLRVSISWPRIMPYNPDTKMHEANQEGIDWYSAIFAEMDKLSITLFVIVFHWDLPNVCLGWKRTLQTLLQIMQTWPMHPSQQSRIGQPSMSPFLFAL